MGLMSAAKIQISSTAAPGEAARGTLTLINVSSSDESLSSACKESHTASFTLSSGGRRRKCGEGSNFNHLKSSIRFHQLGELFSVDVACSLLALECTYANQGTGHVTMNRPGTEKVETDEHLHNSQATQQTQSPHNPQ